MRDAAERFRDKYRIDPETGCWEWQACRDRDGYGRFQYEYQCWQAPRFAFVLHTGRDIPAGLDVLHNCDNPACVNPHHLRLGTVADNMADRDSRGRHNGGKRPVVTLEQAAAIRADPRSQTAIAAAYGIGATTVSRIKRGDSKRYSQEIHG